VTVILSGGRPRTLNLGGPTFPFPPGTQQTTTPTGRIDLIAGSVAYERIVKSQPAVFAVVSKLMWSAARLPFNAYQWTGDAAEGSRERARSSELDILLHKPRPRARGFRLKAPAWWDVLVHGHALIVKVRRGAGAPPRELWNIPWPNVETVSDNSGIVGFRVHLSGDSPIWVSPKDTIYLELPGGSPLEPLRRTLALEDASLDWQQASFANGVTPRGAFVSDAKLDERTMPRLRTELEKLYAGPENAGRFGLFDQGLKWAAMGQSAVDADLVAQRKLSREEVCVAYDVAPPLIGILDSATIGATEVIHNALYVDTLGPKLTMFEDDVQAQLVDDEPAWDGLWVEHNLNELLKPLPEARYRTHLMGQQSSTTTINERRAFENLPRIDDPVADTVFIPANMWPVGTDLPFPDPSAPGVPAQGATEALTTITNEES
jgi:HK97 family phage portal protein